MLKHLLLPIFCTCLLGGCLFHRHTSKNLQEDALPVSTTEMTNDAFSKKDLELPSDAQALQGEVTTSAVSPSSQPATTSQEETSLPAAELVRTARQEQVLATPTPDKAVFKNEELIDLQDRYLNPYTYAPLDPQAIQTAPWKGEQLKYGLYYSFVKAGTAYIKNRGITTVGGRSAYLIQTTAFSAPVIDTVFRVRDVNHSWLDAQDFKSLGYTQSVREGNYKRDEWVIFDYDNNAYYGEVKKKSEPRTVSGRLTGPVSDMLTSLYFVRAHTLTVGTDIVLDLINREEAYPMVVKVLARETVKTPAGKFKCIVVEPQFRGEGIFVSKGKSLKVWLTDDQYKMPVKMKTEVFIGSVSAELLEYKRN